MTEPAIPPATVKLLWGPGSKSWLPATPQRRRMLAYQQRLGTVMNELEEIGGGLRVALTLIDAGVWHLRLCRGVRRAAQYLRAYAAVLAPPSAKAEPSGTPGGAERPRRAHRCGLRHRRGCVRAHHHRGGIFYAVRCGGERAAAYLRDLASRLEVAEAPGTRQ